MEFVDNRITSLSYRKKKTTDIEFNNILLKNIFQNEGKIKTLQIKEI